MAFSFGKQVAGKQIVHGLAMGASLGFDPEEVFDPRRLPTTDALRFVECTNLFSRRASKVANVGSKVCSIGTGYLALGRGIRVLA